MTYRIITVTLSTLCAVHTSALILFMICSGRDRSLALQYVLELPLVPRRIIHIQGPISATLIRLHPG